MEREAEEDTLDLQDQDRTDKMESRVCPEQKGLTEGLEKMVR